MTIINGKLVLVKDIIDKIVDKSGNMYSISMKQVEELQKQQKESLNYVETLKQALNEINLKEEYNKDSVKLLNDINDYEKCMAKNFKDPYKHCYEDKKNGNSK